MNKRIQMGNLGHFTDLQPLTNSFLTPKAKIDLGYIFLPLKTPPYRVTSQIALYSSIEMNPQYPNTGKCCCPCPPPPCPPRPCPPPYYPCPPRPCPPCPPPYYPCPPRPCPPCPPYYPCPPRPCPLPYPPSCPQYVIVTENIEKDTYWCNDKIYIVSAEVHVRVGNTLCIQRGTQVLFKECKLPNTGIGGVPFAVLVIDSGAAIHAEYVSFRSRNGGFNNTGGLIVCGTNANMMFEAYATIQSHDNVPSKQSILKCCSYSKLGVQNYGFNSLTLLQIKDGSELIMEDLSIVDGGFNGLVMFGGNLVTGNLTIKDFLHNCLSLEANATLVVSNSITLVNRALPLPGSGISPGLVNPIGAQGTINTLKIEPAAQVYFFGRITNVLIGGVYGFFGLFAGAVAGEIGLWEGPALPLTSITGFTP
jgi:hypothetical protein